MIIAIKDFIQERINDLDTDFRFDGFGFETDKIGSLNVNHTYKVIIGSMSSSRQDQTIESVIPVSVIIYRIGQNDYFNDFANAYCDAIAIQSEIARQDKLDQSLFIKEFLPTGIEPEALNNDDNIMKFTINFNVRLIYYSKD